MPKAIKPQSKIRKLQTELKRALAKTQTTEVLLARKISELASLKEAGVRATFAGNIRIDPELFAQAVNNATAKAIHSAFCSCRDLSSTEAEKKIYEEYARDWVDKLDKINVPPARA